MHDQHIECPQEKAAKFYEEMKAIEYQKQTPPNESAWGTPDERHNEKLFQRQEWRRDRKKGRR